ncbi:peptide ABC transporter ATP-binding protein [Pseudomonas amygdali pv. tabaci str. ATCC 11528]|uniref:ABC-type dipeptide transporter n=3 Tax=Pseudomonas amygdali TaxID=47877 RepID=A0A0P9QC94_PSEA0|nr:MULTISPECIES: ABC transporter ATP-binding protein [Pseudomonas syringae group]KKY51245.1 peptide ABC transporter ATP-binding protein [Pseudomonas amygdali pv. tabaci str. ATCC 11528]KPB57070.1 Dipeptide transporter dppD-like protein [Pseudomonas amygdali pv. myricae]KPX12267.1 Dipeptide transporter dppD-like protein [Pseudomonas amygdali pv. dendropanacis]KPX70234.1 Dipeptide transporter dppD-like protein [Pseudomonas amygdali pv. photiniae]KPX98675.1 Dipeptide transporter dppD-like protein
MTHEQSLLNVQGLRIGFPGSGPELIEVVKGIDFTVGTEKVALVGESGSGKSLTARALLGLVARPGQVTAEHMSLAGDDLRSLTAKQWQGLRGTRLSLVLQDPRYSLNPVLRVGIQVEEALVLHTRLGRRERREKVLDMLEAVGLPNPLALYDSYPHELSGGMGQRVMLAAMLINDPRLLIADEPTSALDSGLRDQILELILGLVEQRNMGLLLISHDLPLVAKYCDRALVMYRGRIVDRCNAAELATASNPYTQTLWRCQPSALTYGQALATLDRKLMEALP